MTGFAEPEILQEFRHPSQIIRILVWHRHIDGLHDTLGVMLEVLAAVYPLVAAFGLVTRAHRAEETVEEALCDTLSRVSGVDVQFQFESEAIHTTLVAEVVDRRETDDPLRDVLLGTPRLVALGNGDDIRELLRGDVMNTTHDLVESARLVFWSADGFRDIVIVELLNAS
jgi:hypothetical protein